MNILSAHFPRQSRNQTYPVLGISGTFRLRSERNLPTFYNQVFALIRQFANGTDYLKWTGLGAILLNKLPLRVRGKIYDKTANSRNLTPGEPLDLNDIARKQLCMRWVTTYDRLHHKINTRHFMHYRKQGASDNHRPSHATSADNSSTAPFANLRYIFPSTVKSSQHLNVEYNA